MEELGKHGQQVVEGAGVTGAFFGEAVQRACFRFELSLRVEELVQDESPAAIGRSDLGGEGVGEPCGLYVNDEQGRVGQQPAGPPRGAGAFTGPGGRAAQGTNGVGE
ncbi:hypothetical protein QQY24_33080 [Streptomyces sp. TG1A-8]|uniref:hypothetical protein n=1 Tax=Streptomyces sp. TG1A-8 TaxID=3051385 RepID=UPI00265C63A4|nr:hypothetical protein [Streptomyces sp. TG1A-8]MDO0929931.1 hypothetical protein [Streptomyces sp. TG1A-8]